MQLFKRILNFDEATVANREQRLARRFALSESSPLACRLRYGQSEIKAQLLDLSSVGAGLVIPSDSPAIEPDQNCEIELQIDDLHVPLRARLARRQPHPKGLALGLDLAQNDYDSRRNLVQLLEPIEIGSSLVSVDRKSVTQTEPGLLSIRYFSSTSSTLTVWRDVNNHEIKGFEMRMHQYHVRSGRHPPELKLFVDDSTEGSGYSPPTLRPAGEADQEIVRLFSWVVPHINPELPQDMRLYLQQFSSLSAGKSGH